jgi:hypothetical protein
MWPAVTWLTIKNTPPPSFSHFDIEFQKYIDYLLFLALVLQYLGQK